MGSGWEEGGWWESVFFTRSVGKPLATKLLKMLKLGLSRFRVTDVVGSVTHTSKHSSDGSLMVVCVVGDVASVWVGLR